MISKYNFLNITMNTKPTILFRLGHPYISIKLKPITPGISYPNEVGCLKN